MKSNSSPTRLRHPQLLERPKLICSRSFLLQSQVQSKEAANFHRMLAGLPQG